ncbi:MAG: YbgC/FadM family acyl-CoA thioesterase [Alphaproteobacteria bacterium]|nr:YbgC/FadM family acyl-CoA thioesterase [Alphaproteobacteria bacterium]
MSRHRALGRFEGKTHILPLSVYYEDTDLSGFVYHANYLRFMERGRTECLRLAGAALAALEAPEPTAWAILAADVKFRRPARLDDVVEVHTSLNSISGARMTVAQHIMLDGAVLVEARIEACIITLTGKPRRIPPAVRDTLTPLLCQPELPDDKP